LPRGEDRQKSRSRIRILSLQLLRGAAKQLLCASEIGEIRTMPQVLKMSVAVMAIVAFALCGLRPAEAGCQLIKATHSGPSKVEAARSSRALAVQSAYDLKRAKGWSYVHLSARKVKGDPFWKAVRPNGVPPEARLKPDLVSARFYTTCFTGVVVPYVCTTGSMACGH
jgi:hypothetical protein